MAALTTEPYFSKVKLTSYEVARRMFGIACRNLSSIGFKKGLGFGRVLTHPLKCSLRIARTYTLKHYTPRDDAGTLSVHLLHTAI